MFDRLRDALRAALEAATPPGDLRDLSRQMREAVIEAQVAVRELRDALERTGRELAAERQRLAEATRRGRLAAEIQDGETVEVARRFAAKHEERGGVLEKKLAAQREEVALAERELEEMRAELKRAERDRPVTEAERSAARAWRDLGEAGDPLKTELDQSARDAAVEAKLREIKQRMKKE